MPKPFVFNDETQYNSYGFRTANNGIDLTRFKNNPVMLDAHYNDNESVLGKWEQINIDGVNLNGTPVFDAEDENAKKISGKVERGFINGCSMGLLFNPENFVLEPNGKWLLSKSELLEVSIVPVPSNANAISLYVEKDGKIQLLKEDEIELCLSALSENNNNNNFLNDKKNMKKVFLSVAALVALGLDKINNTSDGVDVNIVEDAINNMKQKSDTLQLKLSTAEAALKKYTDAEELRLNAEVNDFVNSVIPSKYDESERESVTKLAKADLAFAKKMADLVPAKQNLSGKINNSAPEPTKASDIKTMEDFQKLSDSAQLAFKNSNPEQYKKIVASI